VHITARQLRPQISFSLITHNRIKPSEYGKI